jgi:hypothetical protein
VRSSIKEYVKFKLTILYTNDYIGEYRMEEFKKRIEVDGYDYCKYLFDYATIRLLSHKYAYYIACNPYIDDITYDLEEKDWRLMGQALNIINADEISPCVGFDAEHPMAVEGVKLANKLIK